MAHQIFGERFLGRSTPAWHELGQVFGQDEHVTVPDAVTAAGCAYELQKVRVPAIEVFGTSVEVPSCAVFRSPTGDDPEPRFLGMVAEDHELFDNIAIAKVLEPLGEHWPVETVFALRKGDAFGVTLKIGRSVLNGTDEVDRYFLVNGNHANGKGIHVLVSTVRVVCANTLAMALDSAVANVSLPHQKGIGSELAAVTALVAKLEHADAEVVSTLERLAACKVSQAQVEKILLSAYPELPERPRVRLGREAEKQGLLTEGMKVAIRDWEMDREAMLRQRAMAWGCYQKVCEEHPVIAGTAWAALNAVTEVENHRVGPNAAASIMFGTRGQTMERALRLAVAIAKEGGDVKGASLRRTRAPRSVATTAAA